MPKRQTSLRLSRRTDNQISELARKFGCTMAEVVAIAINEAWREVERTDWEQAEKGRFQAVAEAQREAARLINEEE